MKKDSFFASLLALSQSSFATMNTPQDTGKDLTYSYCLIAKENFQKAEKSFLQRWKAFKEQRKAFALWSPNWDEKELQTRFQKIVEERNCVYFVNGEEVSTKGAWGVYKQEFQMASDWKLQQSRYSFPCAFAYNLASPTFNCSLINLHKNHFLAMEAPSEKNLPSFLQLLQNFTVTHLVRLTPIQGMEKTGEIRENCFPYWKDRCITDPKNTITTLQLSGRDLAYFATDEWKDRTEIDPKQLLFLVKSVMNSPSETQKMVAIHCRAGVGRTGTFIAAYVLLQEIDRQLGGGIDPQNIQISIDEVFWELALQRSFSITLFSQYVSLYRLVNYYVDHVCSKSHLLTEIPCEQNT